MVTQDANFKVAVVGGDRRQIVVAEALTSYFKEVRIFGHQEGDLPSNVIYKESLAEALTAAQIVVLPIGGMNEAGLVKNYLQTPPIEFGPFFEKLPRGTLVVTGSLRGNWQKLATNLGIQVLEYADNDEIAILNSIPTAEGALMVAMQELPITIHGSTVMVIGFGRVGLAVARCFKALNAQVIVTARRRASLAKAVEMGCEALNNQELALYVNQADIIINTVPAVVLDALVLEKVSTNTLILDLASEPGGVDFEAARRLGLNAQLLPGLPGKIAPKTSGDILARALPSLISEKLIAGV